MKTFTQKEIAALLNVSPTFINLLVKTKKRPSWARAKQLAKITGTTPELWLDGTTSEIRKALKQNNSTHKN